MSTRRLLTLLVLTGLAFGLLACNLNPPQTESTSPTPAGTSFPLPQTEADAPRVTAAEAKAAVDAGLAIIVDVRSVSDYARKHIAGARSIPLDRIEADPAGVSLEKNKWIITYCT
jgi:hypothetical protein